MYSFSLVVPQESVGRAMSDLRQRFAKFDSPEFETVGEGGGVAVLKGTAPVSTMQDYSAEVHSYTGGNGHLTLELGGYDVCHDAEAVVEEMGYDSESDAANPTGSVFCAHGAGFIVPWDQVEDYMHLPYAYVPQGDEASDDFGEGGITPGSGSAGGRAYDTTGAMTSVKQAEAKGKSSWELDKELQQIYEREFGMNKDAVEDQERRRWIKKNKTTPKPATVKYDKKGNPIYPSRGPQEECLIVDGYNIIFAWEDLKSLLKVNIDSARDKLLDILSGYQGYRGGRLIVVFDAYKRREHPGTKSRYHNIEVVFTRTDETADAYIERTVHDISGKYKITVATNDGLEQLTVMSQGALRMSAANLREEIDRVSSEGLEQYMIQGSKDT
jgi:predicted RNA-binding protein with PIN domain